MGEHKRGVGNGGGVDSPLVDLPPLLLIKLNIPNPKLLKHSKKSQD